MAKIKINNVRIKGIAACAPSKVEENSEYPYFDENEFENIIPSIGVERRHVAKEGQTCADFAQRAAEKLMEELGMGERKHRPAHLWLPFQRLYPAGHGLCAARQA